MVLWAVHDHFYKTINVNRKGGNLFMTPKKMAEEAHELMLKGFH